ncbi:MAG: DUF86 domain-containing protein [Nitrospirae bacterium]|nr:DUF86 domain-containing protein [Nitrospirota bacterium]MDA8340118.1 DUF86 domain-containing protein [Nitrospiraceae bacterium]
MQKEFKVRLIRHITFLESELKDYDAFNSLSWEQYNADRNKRRNVERWVRLRNIISHEYLDIRWASIKRFISESRPLFEGFLAATNGYLERKEQQDSAETA